MKSREGNLSMMAQHGKFHRNHSYLALSRRTTSRKKDFFQECILRAFLTILKAKQQDLVFIFYRTKFLVKQLLPTAFNGR